MKLLVALAALALTGCATTADASPYKTCPNGTVVRKSAVCPAPAPAPPPPTPTPVPVPPPPPPAPTPAMPGEAPIADNVSGGISPNPNPAGVSGDVVGAFRMFCTAGPLLKVDPLVIPGTVGVSHLHQFFGNSGVNENSNYQSLRTTGGTTCGSTPYNRSAYWVPAMLDGIGNVVKPDYFNLYYKRNPIGDPMCRPLSSAYQSLGQCVDLPNGIRFVFGYNTKTGTNAIGDPNGSEHWSIRYECWASEDGSVSNGTATGRYWTISDVAAAGCPVGARLMILVNAPNCWDGTNLVAADFRSNVAFNTGPYFAGQMFNACPVDHSYVIPAMSVQIAFTVDANLATWHLSSDEMVAGAANGSTFHMDYWEAWSPTIKATWHQYCINGHLTCSSGDLGNSTMLDGAGEPNGGWPKHQFVPAN